MTSPPEQLVQIQNNFKELFLMILLPKLIRMFSSAEQHGYLSLKKSCSDFCLLLILTFTKSLVLRSTEIAGPKAFDMLSIVHAVPERNHCKTLILKSQTYLDDISLCQDSGERSRALGPSCLLN